MIGKVLNNRYRLEKELGNGGMAWVYLAEDLREERAVAVKILYPQLSQDVGFLQRFSREAKLAMGLTRSTPEMHIVQVLDYGSDRDIQYLVMEFVPGQDLRKMLDELGSLTWQEALDIGRQVALALGHADQHGIVHRDVKPENIMILPDGTVRVLDFGVARARTSPTLTHSGFVGSPYYAAPEQAMGHSADIRADLYSLGIVLYEIVTGDRPFPSDTPWQVINHHIASPPPLLEESHPELPGSVSRLVRKAMAKRPEDRIQTPIEMTQAIEAVLMGRELPLESTAADLELLAPILDGLYQRAQQAATDGDWREAVDLYSQILKLDARYRDVTEQLAEAGRQARLAALYTGAQRALKIEDWSEAMEQLDEIVTVAPEYRDVRDLQDRVREMHRLDRLYRQGLAYLETGQWHLAVRCLDRVQKQQSNYRQTARLLATARAEEQKGRQHPRLRGRNEPRRRKNLLWAIVAILIVALGVECYLLYRAQQPPAIASVFVPETYEPQATGVALPPLPPGQLVTPVEMPQPTRQAAPSPTPTERQPAATTPMPTVAPSSTPTAAATSSSTPPSRPIATASSTATAETLPVGQIAFPRFDAQRSTYDVFVCQLDGVSCRRVATEASQPDFLPDGRQLVVHSWQADAKGLVLQTLDGQRIWQITDGLEAARPSVDFRGELYAYHTRQEADRLPRLYRTYGPDTRPVLREGSRVRGQSPAWLPDGRIVYSGCLADACGIIVTQADGAFPRQVVAGSSETNPEASPDGRRVTFMSRRDGNWEVYLVNLDGSGLRRLTHSPANDGLPTWSPDGRHIAFVSDRDGAWAIWTLAVEDNGRQPRRLFAIGGSLDGRVGQAAAHESHGWVEERISWVPLP